MKGGWIYLPAPMDINTREHFSAIKDNLNVSFFPVFIFKWKKNWFKQFRAQSFWSDMSVASCLCAVVYALFWRKVTNIGYPPIIVWENQICSADFGYAVSPCISKMVCFSNTAFIWTKPTDGICTNPANSALHNILTKATAKSAARQCKFSHFGVVWPREVLVSGYVHQYELRS